MYGRQRPPFTATTPTAKTLQITGDLRSYFATNDYIMLFDNDDNHNTGRQAVARITAESYSSSTGRTTFTLTDIVGTISRHRHPGYGITTVDRPKPDLVCLTAPPWIRRLRL